MSSSAEQSSSSSSESPENPESSYEFVVDGEIHSSKLYTREFNLFDPRGETIQHRFRTWIEKYADQEALGYREKIGEKEWSEYKYLTYKEFGTLVDNVAAGLVKLGFKKGDHIGIASKNCYQWIVFDMACACQGFVSVPVYDSYGASICTYLMEHSDCTGVLVQAENIHIIRDGKAQGRLANLNVVIGLDSQPAQGMNFDGCTHMLSEVIKLGQENPVADAEVKPDDLLTIVYTSGTSGTPKGVMLSQENMCYGYRMMGGRIAPRFERSRLISYLPLAHVFDRTIEYSHFERGACVGYFHGEMGGILSDLSAFKPNTFPVVPRALLKMYDGVVGAINNLSWFKRKMFYFALEWKMKKSYLERCRTDTWADKILKSVRDKVGGQITMVVSGAAATPPKVVDFFQTILACPFGEGYGQTETSCGITGPHFEWMQTQTVGFPFDYCEVALASIPSMGYDAKEGRGEICARGPHVFKGYYKDPESTAKVLTPDGWCRTGDVGEWVDSYAKANGTALELIPIEREQHKKDFKAKKITKEEYDQILAAEKEEDALPLLQQLRIIDRINNVVKMSNGEFVVSEVLEQSYIGGSTEIRGTQVTLESFLSAWTLVPPRTMDFLVVVCSPRWDALLSPANAAITGAGNWPGVKEWWDTAPRKEGAADVIAQPVPQELRTSLAGSTHVSDFVQNLFAHISQGLISSAQIKRFEVISGVVVGAEDWSPENELTTASFKTRRNSVVQFYRQKIDQEIERIKNLAGENGGFFRRPRPFGTN